MTDTPTPEVKFLDIIIKLIVTDPTQVEISRTVDDLGVLITLKVAKEDMGRIIGKDGNTAKAIRTLLRAIGSRSDERINFKILEPDEEMLAASVSADDSLEEPSEESSESSAVDAPVSSPLDKNPADLSSSEVSDEDPVESTQSGHETHDDAPVIDDLESHTPGELPADPADISSGDL